MTIPSGAINNGLPAEDWARLDRVPYPVMQHLMVALRGAGIAAYSISDIDESPFRALSRRSPLDQRIYVDRTKLDRARSILGEEIAAHEESILSGAVDTEFANVIAQFDAPTLVIEEEHFEPPTPALEISADPVTRAAWVGIIGGPILLFLSLFGVISLDGLAPMLGILAFVAGFITLVVRMPDRLPIDEGPDDGAVV